MTDCSKCGDCCENIWIPVSPQEISNAKQPSGHNFTFIRDHWIHLESKVGTHKYKCTMFDEETRLCTAHETRPPVCRDFPYYGGIEITAKLSKNCSFNADIRDRPMLPIVAVS